MKKQWIAEYEQLQEGNEKLKAYIQVKNKEIHDLKEMLKEKLAQTL